MDSVESALAAEAGGADRLELCSNLIIGGTTPTLALFDEIRNRTDIRIHALIRPRFGDFLYTDYEAAIICREITAFRQAGAEGVVIGSLNPDGSLNWEQLKRFAECAGDMSITLHRAFDMCADPFSALEQASQLGIDTILTSGQAASCVEGIALLNQLTEIADTLSETGTRTGKSISLLAGAGINASAVSALLEQTSLTQFHMSGKAVLNSGMQYRNPKVSMGLPGFSEYEIWRTEEAAVRSVRKLLDTAQ